MTEIIKQTIRTIPNWPRAGVMFRDITPLFKNPKAFKRILDLLEKRYKNSAVDKIIGIESRGFVVAAALADRLGVGFVPVRKKGKLPAATISEEYDLEYGKDKIEIHTDAITKGENVLVVDDLIATGGTALAACNLVGKLGGKVVECCFVIDLPDLGGKKKLLAKGFKAFNLVEFEGE